MLGTGASLDAAGVESEWLNQRELASRLPQFKIEPHTIIALWQRMGLSARLGMHINTLGLG